MKSIIVLLRHGNTFEAGQTAVMVGSHEDPPLTAAGEEQARAVGAALAAAGPAPEIVMCGPLLRTRRYAGLVCECLRLDRGFTVDPRLTELDYGGWSGLSNEEIEARFGSEELRRWNEEGIRPSCVDFQPPAESVRCDAVAVLNECADRYRFSVIVTSNGRLKAFGAVCADEGDTGEFRGFKMKTGAVSLVTRTNGKFRIEGWNIASDAVRELLAEHIKP